MKETSLLAPSYVPQHVRAVHTLPITAVVNAFFGFNKQPHQQQRKASATDAAVNRVYQSLCYCQHPCLCTPERRDKHRQTQQNRIPKSLFPNKDYCYYYAVSKEGQQKHPNTSMEQDKSSSETTTKAHLLAVESVSNKQEYVDVFSKLLKEEYERLMILYERYSAYNVSIQPLTTTTTRPQASILIPGIYDARPSVQTGDTLLIRPHETVVLRPPVVVQGPTTHQVMHLQHQQALLYHQQERIHELQNKANYYKEYLQQEAQLIFKQQQQLVNDYNRLLAGNTSTFTHQDRVEIRTTVLRSLKNDKLVSSWLQQQNEEFSHLAESLTDQTYSVRIIPNSTKYDRCWTALVWLMVEIPDDHGKELLFPTQAPVLPPYTPPQVYTALAGVATTASTDANNASESNSNGKGGETNNLNEQQLSFCRMVLLRTAHPSMDKVRPPMVLTGPAGTGKTKALLVSLLKVLEYGETTNSTKRILVCTPSHTAADVIAKRLSQRLSQHELFRLYDPHRPVETVPVELLPYTSQSSSLAGGNGNEDGDGGGDFTIPQGSQLLNYRVVVCTCADAHHLYVCGLTNTGLRERRECLQTYCETVLRQSHFHTWSNNANGSSEHPYTSSIMASKSATTKDQEQQQHPHFTHLFVDEAAQATEPETLIPFSVVIDTEPNVPKVEIALIGDPRQLSPNIYSDHCEGLQKSLLERLLRLPVDSLGGGRGHLLGAPTKDTWTTLEELIEYSLHSNTSNKPSTAQQEEQHLSTFLTTSYRGHPSFLIMPSKLFYFNKLKSVHSLEVVQEEWLQRLQSIQSLATPVVVGGGVPSPKPWPIHFRGVVDTDQSISVESFHPNSWQNVREAETVVAIIVQMMSSGIQTEKFSTQSIGVMAAFRAQVLLIRTLLRSAGLGSVNVGMVEDYQAAEKDVIILSLTRSSTAFVDSDVSRRAGLFRQPKRMNVALTRAEKLLIVVGNPNTMGEDRIWKQWLKFCLHHGFWYGEAGEPDLVPSLMTSDS